MAGPTRTGEERTLEIGGLGPEGDTLPVGSGSTFQNPGMAPSKTCFNWSSGKDSALALYHLLQDGRYAVDYLLTSINEPLQRVTMHGTRVELLRQQVAALGIPGGTYSLSANPSNQEYENRLQEKLSLLVDQDFEYVAFGDIYLEDLRKYREGLLDGLNLEAIFPLWKRDTRSLLQEFISLEFQAVVVAVNASVLDQSFVGRSLDADFLADLPPGVDPCGENGEFHTFCHAGPIFKHPVPFTIGDPVYREYTNGPTQHGFWFCDLLPIP